MDSQSQILREALALPPHARANIAAELLASLDEAATEDPADVSAEWAVEIERRAQRVISGDSPSESWEDVRARIARRLS